MKTYNFIEAVRHLSNGLPVTTIVCGRATTIIIEDDMFFCVEYDAPLLNYLEWSEIVELQFSEKTLPNVGTLVLVPTKSIDGYLIGAISEITNVDDMQVRCGDRIIYTTLADIRTVDSLIGTEVLLN